MTEGTVRELWFHGRLKKTSGIRKELGEDVAITLRDFLLNLPFLSGLPTLSPKIIFVFLCLLVWLRSNVRREYAICVISGTHALQMSFFTVGESAVFKKIS